MCQSLSPAAVLVYRVPSSWEGRKLPWKLLHAALTLTAFVLVVLGLVAVFRFHNATGTPNMYSLHSWLGLTAVLFFSCQVGAQPPPLMPSSAPALPLAVGCLCRGLIRCAPNSSLFPHPSGSWGSLPSCYPGPRPGCGSSTSPFMSSLAPPSSCWPWQHPSPASTRSSSSVCECQSWCEVCGSPFGLELPPSLLRAGPDQGPSCPVSCF